MNRSLAPAERVAYRPAEFAKAAGLGLTTVYERIALGDIPAVRLGSAVMIPASWVRDFLAQATKG